MFTTSSSSSKEEVSYNADLSKVKIIKQLGSPVEQCRLVTGLALPYKVCHTSVKKESSGKKVESPSVVKDAKIAVIQFCISPPKPNMDSSVTVTNASEISAAVQAERKHIIRIVKKLKEAKINCILVQKSILNEAVCDLALHYLAMMNIMCVKDIERDDIQFICDALHCIPIASEDGLIVTDPEAKEGGSKDPFGYAQEVKSVHTPSQGSVLTQTGTLGGTGPSFVQFDGVKEKPGFPNHRVVNFICCAPNQLMLEETERSIHDALCVARSLVKKPFLIPGGGAAETELAVQLGMFSHELSSSQSQIKGKEESENAGLDAVGVRAFGEALETVPLTLAENGGLNPISVLTELRAIHSAGHEKGPEGESEEDRKKREEGKYYGVNMKKTKIADMRELKVAQPMMVTLSAVQLATETVRQILRIDDIVASR